MSLFNVSVWGLGNHAQNRILPALSAMDEIKLIGVCSRNSKVVESCSEQWDCYGWIDPNEMLSSSEVDVVYIATPIGIHFSLAQQAIEAGKNVWCEKPLTCSYIDTKELVSLAEDKDKVLTESFMYLYHPQFQRVKKFVDDSKGVYSVICRFGIPTLDKPGFRNDSKLCGGALWDVASYTTSALLPLFPDQEIKVVFSEVLTKIGESVDSEGRALLKFSGGVTAYLEWGVGIAYKNEIDIWAKDGSFFTDKIFSKPKEFRPHYKIHDLKGNETRETGKQSEQFIDMFRNFIVIMSNKERAFEERKNILQRAKLIDDIVNYNGVKNGKLEKF